MAEDQPAPADTLAETERRRAAGASLLIQLAGTAALVGLAVWMTRQYVKHLRGPRPCAGCAEKAEAAAADLDAASPGDLADAVAAAAGAEAAERAAGDPLPEAMTGGPAANGTGAVSDPRLSAAAEG
jgi:hypothetical protein